MNSDDRLEVHELAARYGDLIDEQRWPGVCVVFPAAA